MKSKEIGMPKHASKAVKREDDRLDKKMKYKEGSKEDLKADKAIMKKYKSKR